MKHWILIIGFLMSANSVFANNYEEYLPEYVARVASGCDLPDLTLEQEHVCRQCRDEAEWNFERDCHEAIERAYDYATGLMDMMVFPKVAQAIAYRDWENAEIEKENCKVRLVHQCFMAGQ